MDTKLSLKNEQLSVSLNDTADSYSGIRFEHSGQVSQVVLNGKHTFLTTEKESFNPAYGFGLLNEFDILCPLQYPQTLVGEGFHKIGVGVLRKTSENPYFFADDYPILEKLEWTRSQTSNDSVTISTLSPDVRGMQYRYTKTLKLDGNRLVIQYQLENTGTVAIPTLHYSHNFLALDNQPVGLDYQLRVGHPIQSETFGEFVSPQNCITLTPDHISWKLAPKTDFFIENLSIGHPELRSWTLSHRGTGTSISESINFEPTRINLWGKGHVISPEIFHAFQVNAGSTATWQREYEFRASY